MYSSCQASLRLRARRPIRAPRLLHQVFIILFSYIFLFVCLLGSGTVTDNASEKMYISFETNVHTPTTSEPPLCYDLFYKF